MDDICIVRIRGAVKQYFRGIKKTCTHFFTKSLAHLSRACTHFIRLFFIRLAFLNRELVLQNRILTALNRALTYIKRALV